MDNSQKKLSNYIDKLNAEKKPKEHSNTNESIEFIELMNTVRLVHSLKAAKMPNADYPNKIAVTLRGDVTNKIKNRTPNRGFIFASVAVIAAVISIVIISKIIFPSDNSNIVYAMEKAYQEVKAYHGMIEIVETNAIGEETVQAIREVWADKEGNYYVKEVEGSRKGVITINNGQKKWQLRQSEEQVHVFPAFPDTYRFTFELENEVEDVKNAIGIKEVGEENIAGRMATILEVTPDGGDAYHLWIDQESKLPLQRRSAMQNALQYRVTYTELDFSDSIPKQLIDYNVPNGYIVIDTNPEQVVNSLAEAAEMIGFTPNVTISLPVGYVLGSIAVLTKTKQVKLYYGTMDHEKTIVTLQEKQSNDFIPDSTAILGTVNNNIAELLYDVEGSEGILLGGTNNTSISDIRSIRWQESGYEYTVLGDTSIEELSLFIQGMTKGEVKLPTAEEELASTSKPDIKVDVDLEVEKNEQKSVDGGHSPWKLDPAFVAQVFVSLLISPEGIVGDYPIAYEDISIVQNTGETAIAEVGGEETPASRVYLERLIRQDSTGIWSVVGYDEQNRGQTPNKTGVRPQTKPAMPFR